MRSRGCARHRAPLSSTLFPHFCFLIPVLSRRRRQTAPNIGATRRDAHTHGNAEGERRTEPNDRKNRHHGCRDGGGANGGDDGCRGMVHDVDVAHPVNDEAS